jgi:hypothetical protein
MKKYSISLTTKKCKSKPHQDFTSFLLGWLPSRTQTTTNVGMQGKRNPHTQLVGM